MIKNEFNIETTIPKNDLIIKDKDKDTNNFLEEEKRKIYLKGINNFYGIEGRVNYKEAYECFKKLYSSGELYNTEIIVLLGIMFENGLHVEQRYKKALELYKEASKKGNGKATYHLAQLAEKKILDEIDQKEQYDDVAFKYYLKSANQGYSDALARIGIILEKGLLNSEINLADAAEYYRKSVEIDENPIGLNGLGNAYFTGIAYKKNYTNAVEFYKRAIHGGNIDALNNLGVCYEFGWGVEQNYIKALDYYSKAKDKNHPEATTNYAILKIKIGINSNNYQNFSECFKILQNSLLLKKKNPEAYYYIGFLYELGVDLFEDNNVIKSPYLAFLNYKKAAELGYTKAITKVGIALYNGIEGIFVHNEKASITLLEKAAQQGDIEAKQYLDFIKKNSETK